MLAIANRSILDTDDLMTAAPSIFATEPWGGMSSRYGFVPTTTIIGRLAGEGYYPVRALQSRSRIEGKEEFTRHMLRFRHADYLARPVLGDEIPELVLTNSHDGTTAYRLSAGIFRLACSNGMVVQSADFGTISVRHVGDGDFADRIIDASYQLIETAGETIGKIDQWKSIALDQPQRLALAAAAISLRDATPVEPGRLLSPRRAADASPDLWTTSSVIQENLMKGGIRARGSTGRRMTTRPIKSVGEDLRVNRAIWALTEKMAELLA